MIVPRDQLPVVKEAAARAADALAPGRPEDPLSLGPVVNRSQYERIQRLIHAGIDEGATLVAGGPDRPDDLPQGFYVKPTVFADTTPDMTIVREEIFGPVLVIQDYETIEEAVALASDTEYGLAAYVQGGDFEQVRAVGGLLAAGQVYLNGSGLDLVDLAAPFGGFKRSGNGREWGEFAFEAFLEPKAMVGYVPA